MSIVKGNELGVARWKWRLLEMLPGLMSWGFLIGLVVFSFIAIDVVAIVIVAYAILWLFKLFGYSQRLVTGYRLMRSLKALDWRHRLQYVTKPEIALKQVDELLSEPNLTSVKRRALKPYRRLLEQQLSNNDEPLDPLDVRHAIIVAAYNESRSIIEPSIKALLDSDYDLDRVMLVLAVEERGGPDIQRTANELVEKYGEYFGDAWVATHPADIPGEIKGKAGNITFAAKQVTELTAERGIDPEHVIVTTLDCDHRVSSDYLAYLTYIYCVSDERYKKSYQPMAMFFNNIWDAPALTRVIATNNSFWLLMEAMRPYRLRNFASHAQSLKGLIEADYWYVRTIVEDGHQYWRMYFTYDGKHTVVPLYTAIYQDAVLADGYLKTFKEQFKQLRRWAYGVSDTPYVIIKSFRDRKIPWSKKFVQIFRQLEGYFSWACAPIVLAIGGWLPLVASQFNSAEIVAHRLPDLTGFILTISLLGLLGPIISSMRAIPSRPDHVSWRRNVSMILQWILTPFSLIIFGSGAALNAQTRLLFGWYLEEFDVTAKHRVEVPPEDANL
jgi:cellulose synthase/poly-beta-1,6-N-acetylglucosamine synthase-like glycosyltransferase